MRQLSRWGGGVAGPLAPPEGRPSCPPPSLARPSPCGDLRATGRERGSSSLRGWRGRGLPTGCGLPPEPHGYHCGWGCRPPDSPLLGEASCRGPRPRGGEGGGSRGTRVSSNPHGAQSHSAPDRTALPPPRPAGVEAAWGLIPSRTAWPSTPPPPYHRGLKPLFPLRTPPSPRPMASQGLRSAVLEHV